MVMGICFVCVALVEFLEYCGLCRVHDPDEESLLNVCYSVDTLKRLLLNDLCYYFET